VHDPVHIVLIEGIEAVAREDAASIDDPFDGTLHRRADGGQFERISLSGFSADELHVQVNRWLGPRTDRFWIDEGSWIREGIDVHAAAAVNQVTVTVRKMSCRRRPFIKMARRGSV
jgi:hypothetical protein